jgi:hypothetical protein
MFASDTNFFDFQASEELAELVDITLEWETQLH